MAYDIPTRFHKVLSRHLREIERTKISGRIRIIVKKKRRIAIHHPASRGDVIIIIIIIIRNGAKTISLQTLFGGLNK